MRCPEKPMPRGMSGKERTNACRQQTVHSNLGLKINFRVSGQPGATPGEGLQPAVLPSLAPGFNLQIKSTLN